MVACRLAFLLVLFPVAAGTPVPAVAASHATPSALDRCHD